MAWYDLTRPTIVDDSGKVRGVSPEQLLREENAAISRIPLGKFNRMSATTGSLPQESVEVNPAWTSGAGASPDTPLLVGGAPDTSNLVTATDTEASTPNLPQSNPAPSFAQATTTPSGMPAPINPAETKLGKFVHFLAAIGQGAMAGSAAQNQALQQSGGRLTAGFGQGFEAAQEAPMQLAMQRQKVQEGAMQAQMQQAQMQPIDTPFGKMPYYQWVKMQEMQKDRYVPLRGGQGGAIDTWTGKTVAQAPAKEPKESTPDQQYLDYVTTANDQQLGRPLHMDEAVDRLYAMKQRVTANKPEVQAFNDLKSQGQSSSQAYETLHPRKAPAGGAAGDDVKQIVDGIVSGNAPPELKGLYRNSAAVRAELQRRGYDLVTAQREWSAMQKLMSTLNGPQQTRLRQTIDTATHSLDTLENLYAQWRQLAPTSGYKVLNRAALTAMKNLPGQPGAVAQALEAQIADITSELGNVYMGGNSPTDHSMGLAAQNLRADWNQETFEKAVQLARTNLQIRRNAIINASTPVGVRENSPYLPPKTETPPAGGGAKNDHSDLGFVPLRPIGQR